MPDRSDRSHPVTAQEQELWENRIVLARRLAELRTAHDRVVSDVAEGHALFERTRNAGDCASLVLDLAQIPGFVSRATIAEAQAQLIGATFSILLITEGLDALAEQHAAIHLEAEIVVTALAMNDAALEELEATPAEAPAAPRVYAVSAFRG